MIGVVHTAASVCRCHETLERALARLGHDVRRVGSEDVPSRAGELARAELVFDQTDTFRGEARRRHEVRALLERSGARCVGSSAAACALADDKARAKEVLRRAGVPVPGAATGWPRVVKPVSEQMSRGLALVRDAAEERRARDAARGPVLVEEFIEGRELAVTVLGNGAAGELRVLPVVEWPLGGAAVLGFEAKRTGPAPVVVPADGTIAGYAARAFEALGLADWARFDIRLAACGTPYFLEANTKPSLEVGSPCLVAAAAAGLDESAFIAEILAIARSRA